MKLTLHDDRLFPADPGTRDVARELFGLIRELPIVSPHGHTDPEWFANNENFGNAAELIVLPDHYVQRMLISQGVPIEVLELDRPARKHSDPRGLWRLFAEHYDSFLATPSRMWLDQVFGEVFGLTSRFGPETADLYYDTITDALATDAYRPRSLYDRFSIEVIATTDSALDDLAYHRGVAASDWSGRVVPTFRPDAVVDPEDPEFSPNLDRLGELTGCDTGAWQGYLDALRQRRLFFKENGTTATDHGHPTALTADLSDDAAASLFDRVRTCKVSADDAELFRAQMLTEMAQMSLDDGLVMQLHVGSLRNHNAGVFRNFGRDRGFDIPQRTGFVKELQPLLNRVGMDPRLSIILFTLDESTYARELAPLAGAYPSLRLGPPWWFHDSFEGIRKYREAVTETAGFRNTAGFNDDTRALCSIPARHDVSRRCDCAFLAELVTNHRLDMDQAASLAPMLATDLARESYRL